MNVLPIPAKYKRKIINSNYPGAVGFYKFLCANMQI